MQIVPVANPIDKCISVEILNKMDMYILVQKKSVGIMTEVQRLIALYIACLPLVSGADLEAC